VIDATDPAQPASSEPQLPDTGTGLGIAPTLVRPTARRYMRNLLIGDLVIIACVVVLVEGLGLWLDHASAATLTAVYVAIGWLVVWPIMLWQRQARAIEALGHGPEEYRRVIVASMWTAALIATVAFVAGMSGAIREFVLTLLLGTALLILFRRVMRRRLDRQWQDGPLQRIFIVAPPDQARRLAFELANISRSFGVAGHEMLRVGPAPLPSRIVGEALAAGADTIVFSPSEATGPEWTRELGWALADSGLNLMVAPSLIDVAGPRLAVIPVQGLPLLRVDIPEFTLAASAVRRVFDIVTAGLLLIVLGIPLLLTALIIKLDSPGPALFKQPRVGRGGRTFNVLKFRTMVDGADQIRDDLRETSESDSSEVLFKLRRDPRITRIGSFLRRWSIDELPQLLNVLRGDMSIVGPRPHSLDDVQRYDKHADRRWLTKPGMTGLWQVSGRSDLDWDTSLRLDLYYVDNWTPALDLVILLRTLGAVIGGNGAY
jgi:exopolysaccharide biosynthesis polyprenyl glycosylphosphotransferase